MKQPEYDSNDTVGGTIESYLQNLGVSEDQSELMVNLSLGDLSFGEPSPEEIEETVEDIFHRDYKEGLTPNQRYTELKDSDSLSVVPEEDYDEFVENVVGVIRDGVCGNLLGPASLGTEYTEVERDH